MGRPRLNIDPAQVYKLARLYCTNEEIADVLGCSPATLTTRFQAELTKGRAAIKRRLRREQLRLALHPEADLRGKATMLVFLGKQMLGQRDRQEVTGADGAPLVPDSDVTVDAVVARLAALGAGK